MNPYSDQNANLLRYGEAKQDNFREIKPLKLCNSCYDEYPLSLMFPVGAKTEHRFLCFRHAHSYLIGINDQGHLEHYSGRDCTSYDDFPRYIVQNVADPGRLFTAVDRLRKLFISSYFQNIPKDILVEALTEYQQAAATVYGNNAGQAQYY